MFFLFIIYYILKEDFDTIPFLCFKTDQIGDAVTDIGSACKIVVSTTPSSQASH